MDRLMDVWAEIEAARKGKKLVFTNGVFDVLHAGHVHLLNEASKLGDLLVVGLNSDNSVRQLGKGPERPINQLEDRMTVVSALKPVDFVVSFDETTPVALIQRLKPDVHVKGGDYQVEDLPETPVVRSYGGTVIVVPMLEGRSSTETLRRLGRQ
jgi:rfaE bifunctional protein nucleotidyltransferase chain/domain